MVQAPWVPLQAEAPRRRRVHRQSWRGGRVESLAARAALRAQGWRPRCACPGVACVVLDSAAALRAVVMPCSARQRCLCHSPRALHAPRRPPPPPPPPPRVVQPARLHPRPQAHRAVLVVVFEAKPTLPLALSAARPPPAAQVPGFASRWGRGVGGTGGGLVVGGPPLLLGRWRTCHCACTPGSR